MKVVISLNSAWAAYNFRYDLATFLKGKGFIVIFVVPKDKYIDKLEKHFTTSNIKINNSSKNPISDIILIYKFYRKYKEINPDIILHYNIKANIYGTLAASLLNIPTINNIAGLGTIFENKTILTKVVTLLYKLSLTRATSVFFQNKDDFSLFTSKNIVHRDKCTVLPGSGVNITKFTPVKRKKTDKIIFLLAARLLWSKGVGEYVEAARIINKKYNNVEFQILGFLDFNNPSAITKDVMNSWVSEGNINYLGVSDNVKIQLSTVDCVVLPSFYREGVPKILLEALGMGKPIITTDSIGCREVVDDGINGYLCQVKDAQDLADKLELFIKLSPLNREVMGTNSREKAVTQFDQEIIFSHYSYAINSILTKYP